MEQQRQKWVNLSFIAVSALLGFIVFALALKLSGVFDLETKIKNIDWVIRIGSVAVAGVSFLILLRHKDANAFMDDVILEITRVTWPPQKDTGRATIVVVIMVLIAGMILGGMDVFLAWLFKMLF